jgi:hypothetical protein
MRGCPFTAISSNADSESIPEVWLLKSLSVRSGGSGGIDFASINPQRIRIWRFNAFWISRVNDYLNNNVYKTHVKA